MISHLKRIIEKNQFEPGIIGLIVNPFYIARKGLLKHIQQLGGRISGKTLDVGCGTKPYEKFFRSDDYVGLEINTTIHKARSKADIYYDGGKFPFNDKEFDSLVTNQVLEHVFTPQDFLIEINRVLKIKGKLLLSVPFVWDEHEQPCDFARYSSFGLIFLLEKHGFKIIEHRKSVNDIKVIFQLLNAYVYKKTASNFILKQLAMLIIMFPVNVISIILGTMLPSNNDLYLDNIILAEKIKDV